MFRKIISSLSFSPAIVERLAAYAKTTKKEESIRKMGVIFLAVAILFQVFAIIAPPKSSNNSSTGDIIYGGVGIDHEGLSNVLTNFDSNTNNFRAVAVSLGINRSDISNSQFGSWNVSDKYLWNLYPYFSSNSTENAYALYDSSGSKNAVAYVRPAKLMIKNNRKVSGWLGESNRVGRFVIDSSSGNIMTSIIPGGLISAENKNISVSISAINITQNNIDAETDAANAGDIIEYNVSAKNNSTVPFEYSFRTNINDALEYAELTDDLGGGVFDNQSRSLTWDATIIAPGASDFRIYSVRILDKIPLTSVGSYNSQSFDCKIVNVYGNAYAVKVNCPVLKQYDMMIEQAPVIDAIARIIISLILFATIVFFYAKSRLINKEIRLVRRQMNRGAL